MRHTSPRPTASLRRSRPRLRLVVALAALLLAVALPAQADPTSDDPVLSVVVEEGKPPVTIAWSQLAGHLDADPVAYDNGRQRTPRGIHLDSALARAGILPQTYSDVRAMADDGLMIGKLDLVAHAAILFRADDGTLRLLRRSMSTMPGGERVLDAVDGTLALRLLRTTELVASMEEVEPGGELTFYVSIPPQLDPAAVTYEWDFNDDRAPRRTSEPSVSHRFQARGRQDTPYNVSVTLYVDGRRYDEMLPLIKTITVKIPEGDKYKGLGADAGNGRAHTSGRGRDGVHAGESRGRQEEPPDGGSGGGWGGGTGGGSGSGYDDDGSVSTPSAPEQPRVTPAATPPPARRSVPRASRRARRTPPAPAGETVDGYLLASADAPLITAGGTVQDALNPQARGLPQPDDDPLRIPTGALVAAGLLALVVLGWGLESRTTLPYFRP